MWLLYAFLSAFFAAAVAIFGKLGLEKIDPALATTLRGTIMAAFLIAASFVMKKFEGFTISAMGYREWIFIALSGVAGALSWLFYFIALKQGLVDRVVAIDRLSIVFVVIFASIFLGEAFGWKTALGAVLMVAGAFFITLK